MKILAFDLATKTGVAFGRPGDKPILWTENLGKTQEQRFAQALRMTRRLIRKHEPDMIVIEAPRMSGGTGAAAAVETLMGIRGCVIGIAQIEGVPAKCYPVQTIRKHFLGHGNLRRAEAKRAALQRCKMLGWVATDDNQADAGALWDLACALNSHQFTLPPESLFGR